MGDFIKYPSTCKTRERRLFSVQVCVLFLSSLAFAARLRMGGGSLTWPIPMAWRFAFGNGTLPQNVFTEYTQRFELDADGTVRIKKFGYCAERTTNNVHNITGGIL